MYRAHSLSIGISFKLLAVDYLFKHPIAALVDKEELLPGTLWDIPLTDNFDFDHFVTLALQQIGAAVHKDKDIDPRKRELFSILYSAHGNISAEATTVYLNAYPPCSDSD